MGTREIKEGTQVNRERKRRDGNMWKDLTFLAIARHSEQLRRRSVAADRGWKLQGTPPVAAERAGESEK